MPADAIAPTPPRSHEGARRVVEADRERQILEMFRHIGAFRTNYDAAVLERAAAYATSQFGPTLGDELMAAAIRLDNEMRCQPHLDYTPMPIGSPHRHESEEAFLGLLRALSSHSERAALGFAGRLGITETRTLFASARALAAIAGWPAKVNWREAFPSPAQTRVAPARMAYGQA
jgi:hypothetical protein